MSAIGYKLDIRDRPPLLVAIMQACAGSGSKISFEGYLSTTELTQLEDVASEETPLLKRATLWPKLDFLVLPLTEQTFSAIKKAIISKIAFGERGIVHVQIEKNGQIAFAAYDNFQHGWVAADTPISTTLLEDLIQTRVLRGYTESAK
jgi:hypothetical protein